jgi:DNA-binding IscR family transcriptional regulator
VELWSAARKAVEEVYDGTTFQDLVEREAQFDRRAAGDYCI